ncbi:hypothetical protein HK102_001265 [Quaeritorhiza haematococci]|nr:hypothetical protein HK102_001265 [Quaeritorhiza haematococci]
MCSSQKDSKTTTTSSNTSPNPEDINSNTNNDTSNNKPSSSSSSFSSRFFSLGSSSSSPFPLPDLFSKSKAIQSEVLTFPWLLSDSPPRKPLPTFWSTVRDKQLLAAGTKRARTHLHKPYDFPHSFIDDATEAVKDLFDLMSDPERACEEEEVREIMIRALAERFIPEYRKLRERGQRVEFLFPQRSLATKAKNRLLVSTDPEEQEREAARRRNASTPLLPAGEEEEHQHLELSRSVMAMDGSKSAVQSYTPEEYVEDKWEGIPLDIRVTGVNFTYGPYPPPPDHVVQNWWNFVNLVIPKEDSFFKSYPDQKRVMQRAMDEGVYIKVDTVLEAHVEFVLWDENGGAGAMPLMRDRRKRIEIQFVSPHFNPWDEIFELDERGKWRLRWQWRVSDIDHLVRSAMPEADDSPKIDWRAPVF